MRITVSNAKGQTKRTELSNQPTKLSWEPRVVFFAVWETTCPYKLGSEIIKVLCPQKDTEMQGLERRTGDVGMRETWGWGESKSLREQLMQKGVNAVRNNESYKWFCDSAACHLGSGLDVQRVAVTLTGLGDDSTSQCPALQRLDSDNDTLSDDRKDSTCYWHGLPVNWG